MRYTIIGAGIAAITAAKTLREHDADSKIIVYADEIHPMGLYARKDLARRFATGIHEPEELLLESQEALAGLQIDFEYMKIERIFANSHQILRAHTVRQPYDRLLLATGATPKLVDAPGLHLIGVHQVGNYEDISLIDAWLPELQQRGAVVIGGGILGLDMAYALNRRGVPTTLVVREAHVGIPLLSGTAADLIERRLRMDGITVITEETVTEYISTDDKMLDAVRLNSGKIINTRMALCAVGVHPNAELAEDDIDVDVSTGAIRVNTMMQTSAPDVYAAGVCASVDGLVARNWKTSAEQGRVAALNMLGQTTHFDLNLQGDLESQIYDLPFSYFGQLNPSTNSQVWAWDNDHSEYVQILIEEGRIVGATMIGDINKLAPALYQVYRAQASVAIEDLEAMVAN